MKFRKKPVVIEAVQLRWTNWSEVCEFLKDVVSLSNPATYGDASDTCGEHAPYINLLIPTLEGPMTAKHGDWIIKGVNGEFYPCKPDIFAKTYEGVDEEPVAVHVKRHCGGCDEYDGTEPDRNCKGI